MATLTVAVAGATLFLLYEKAYDRQLQWLNETAQSNASYMDAIAEHELETHNQDFGHAFERTINQTRAAHRHLASISVDTSYVVAGEKNGQLTFILHHDAPSSTLRPIATAIKSIYATPFRRGLQGDSGILVGVDSDGSDAIFAYAPVPYLNVVVVIKRNLQSFRQPFIKAGVVAAGTGLIFIVIASLFFVRIGNPLIVSEEINRSQLQTVLNTIVDGVLTCDPNGRITSFNGAAESIFGYTEAEVLNQNIAILVPTDTAELHNAYMQQHSQGDAVLLHGITGFSREVMGQHRNGTVFPVDIAISENIINGATVFTAIVRDITQRKHIEAELNKHRLNLEEKIAQRTADLAEANAQLSRLARLDSLTGLANRRVFDETIEQEMRRSQRLNIPLTLLMCDIDYFKNYNDSLGHLAGDECLKTVAALIQSQFKRAGEVAVRYGGEEFAVILPSVATPDAQGMAKGLLIALEQLNIPHPSSSISKQLTLSVGIATSHQGHLTEKDQLINAADQALYQAKTNGRNQVAWFKEQTPLPKTQPPHS